MYNEIGYYYIFYKHATDYGRKDEYDINYEYMEVELDAEKTANTKLRVYLENLYRKYNLDISKLKY